MVTEVNRPQAFRDALVAAWQEKTGPTLVNTRGQFTLALTKRPEFIRNKQGTIVGVEAWVKLFHGRVDAAGKWLWNELPIDPHRRCINPPTQIVTQRAVYQTDADGKASLDEKGQPILITPRQLRFDPLAAFWQWLWDSVQRVPGNAR